MSAPILTQEIREQLKKEYDAKKNIAGFLMYYYPDGDLIVHPFPSMAALYDARFNLATDLDIDIEDFLVINTFKEFEPETGEE